MLFNSFFQLNSLRNQLQTTDYIAKNESLDENSEKTIDRKLKNDIQ